MKGECTLRLALLALLWWSHARIIGDTCGDKLDCMNGLLRHMGESLLWSNGDKNHCPGPGNNWPPNILPGAPSGPSLVDCSSNALGPFSVERGANT
mmetsp:Transcript_23333/g.34238  ORF Transcript_23333/g.34238 Transcript_23333/m.34238 type:complete len:96 (-) Transcript_23333:319-606(-)